MKDNRIIIRFVTSGVLVIQAPPKGSIVAGRGLVRDGRLSREIFDRLIIDKAHKRSDVIVVLPRRQVIFKYFSLPTKNQDELRQMVELQVGRGLPFSAQEMVFQISTAGTDAQGLTRVVVAVARQKMIQECLDVLSASGLSPSRCAISAFGVAAWHARRFPADADQLVLVVDADTDGFEYCFCKDKQLLFARSVSLAEDPGVSNSVALQADLTLQAFRATYPDAALAKVIITGVRDHWGILRESLTQKAQVSCLEVEAEDPRLNSGSVEDDSRLEPQGSMCSLLGMIYASDTGPDLMPSSVQRSKHSRFEVFAMLRMFVALVFCLGAVTYMIHQRVSRQEDVLRLVRQRISQTRTDYEQARRNLKLYDYFLRDRSEKILIADLFKELYAALPASIVLTNVQYADGNLMVLGQTRESADVGNFQKAMMNSAVFKDVTLAYANRPQRLAMEYTEFKIVCRARASAGGHL